MTSVDFRHMDVTVLYGGNSAEREISLRSGAAVAKCLEQARLARDIALDLTSVESELDTHVPTCCTYCRQAGVESSSYGRT